MSQGATKLRIEQIRTDGGTQSRERLSDEAVNDYADAYKSKGVTMPPVVVFYDGDEYWLADGFHRIAAALKAGRNKLDADVHQGSQRDAILYSVGANARHGERRSNADKRRAVTLLLKDEEWGAKSDRWIAEKCGVSHTLVQKQRGELATVASSSKPTGRTGKDGKTRKQPKRKPRAAAKPQLSLVNGGAEPDAHRLEEFDEHAVCADLTDRIAALIAAWPRDKSMEPLATVLDCQLQEVESLEKARRRKAQ